MQKREIKAEQKSAGDKQKATPVKRAEKVVAAASEKTSPAKKPIATVFEEKKSVVDVQAKVSDHAEKKPKKEKATDDCEPVKPKKPSSAYVFFATEQSKIFREEKSYSVVEAMKAAGALWNTLSPAEKEKYKKMQEKDEAR